MQETWYWHGNINANKVVMSGVKCSGTELSLAHCRHDGEDVACPEGGVRYGAGVACSESESSWGSRQLSCQAPGGSQSLTGYSLQGSAWGLCYEPSKMESRDGFLLSEKNQGQEELPP